MSRYAIGQLAKEFGLTTRTLRFYEGLGLLHPEKLGSGNGAIRVFSERDRTNVMTILEAKRLGYRVDQMQHQLMQDDGRIVIPLDVLRKQQQQLADRIAESNTALTRLYAIEREQLDAVAA